MYFFVWGFQINMFDRCHSKDLLSGLNHLKGENLKQIIGALINEPMLSLFEVQYFDQEQMHLHGINRIRYI